MLFLRNWPYVWNLAKQGQQQGRGQVRRRPASRPERPRRLHPGWPRLGISTYAKNKGTAMKFINWYQQGEPDDAAAEGLAGSGAGIRCTTIAALQKQLPYLTTL